MKLTELAVGYMPLVDAAPLIVALEMGFAAQEGLALDLRGAPSWSSLRDMLALGQVAAAHMLAPVPVAAALGLGGTGAAFSVLSVLSVNGNVIGVSRNMARRLQSHGHDFAFDDAARAGRALAAVAGGRLRIGVPFPFSMHMELITYWLSALAPGMRGTVEIHTVPPRFMAEAIGAGEIDVFCVGEPWGSIAVERAMGSLLLPGSAIWSFAPEKVLAVRDDWVRSHQTLAERLIRALWRAECWLADPRSHLLAAELLSRDCWLGVPAEIIDRALSGILTITPRGLQRKVSGFVEFHKGAAGFPWRSQGRWIAGRLAIRANLDRPAAAEAGARLCRSDFYRKALRMTDADLPGASSKVEGATPVETAVASERGTLILPPNRFFDRRIFDPGPRQ